MRDVVPIRTDLEVQTHTGSPDDSQLDALARR